MTALGNATPLVCVVVLILSLVVPPAAQQDGGCPPCNCPQNTVSVGVLVGSCIAVLVGTLIIEALAILCYRKYCKEKPQKVAHRFMISPDEELVVKENLAYESDSEVHERSLRAAKEQKRASIFSISETKDNLMYVPALYRNPISKDRDTGNAIMNGYYDYEPDYDMDNIYTYNSGWGSRVPNILSGKAHASSLDDLYMDTDEYPILRTPQGGVGPVNFASSKFRDGFGRKNIDVHEDNGEVTTYTYTTGFGGKARREVATVTTEKDDDIEFVGDRVTWRRAKTPDEVVLDMDEEAAPETRIAIDDNFTIGRPTSTKRQDYTEATIHSETPGTSFDPSGNFILRATPSTSRSDSSDDDLYDYGDITERQQQAVNSHKHSQPGKIGHGTFRATIGDIPLDRRHSADETPDELFNSRYRYSTGYNKAKLVAMRAAAAAHAREGLINEEEISTEDDDESPVFGYIKLVRPDSDPGGASEGQQYRAATTRDPGAPNAVRLYPVDSAGQPITLRSRVLGGLVRDSYIRHRRETYVEVADTGVQCEITSYKDRPSTSTVTQERTSILRKDKVSYGPDVDPMDDIPTIGVIRLMHPKSSKHVRIKEDQTDFGTISFSEEDEFATSLEDITYRSTSRSTDRLASRPRRARSAPARSEHAPIEGEHPFDEVPTIGVIRLVRPDSASDSSGVESEITSGEESSPEDRPRGQRDKSTQHEVPIVRLAQQILRESVHERSSSQRSLDSMNQNMDDIPTIGVVRLVRPTSTTRESQRMSGPRMKEQSETSEEMTRRVTTSRAAPVSDMPTIGVIKLLRPDSRKEPTSPISSVDKAIQPENTWAQLLREMHSIVENEILRKSTKRQHGQPTDETDGVARTIGVIKLKREEVAIEPHTPLSLVDHSTQSEETEVRDCATMPTFSWSHLVHEVENQIESRYKRMSAPAPRDDFDISHAVQKLGVIELKAAPERIVRDSFTQVSGPHTYEKSTGPAWGFNEIREEIEEEAVEKFKKTLRQLDRPAELQELHEPVRSVSVIKLKKEPQQEKLLRDSFTQISGPNTYEKSTGPATSFNEIKEDIEEEAVRKFKRTLSQLERPAVRQDYPEPVSTVSVIKLKKGPEPDKPTVTSRGIQPDLPWRELKEEIEDEAIEEYKKRMRRFQPKEVVENVSAIEAPRVSVIKLKGPKTKSAPVKRDIITQCDMTDPKPTVTDQVTEPARPWSDVLHNVRRILENEYRRTINELETRLTSLPKNEPITETVPTVAFFKLKGPDVKPEPEKPAMVDVKTQAAPHTSEQETAPERSWKHVLYDVRQILENEYRRTIRELEDQLGGKDEPDVGKTMAVFKLSAPEVPKVQTVSMCTQCEVPQTGEQGTVPERPWVSLIQDVRSSVENEYRVTIRELESQLAQRPKDEPKEPTRLGIFKLRGPKQPKTKKPVVHDSFTQSEVQQSTNKSTQPAQPWLSLMSEIEESIEKRLLKKRKPVEVEPEIVQQTQQIVEMAPQLGPTTTDATTQSSEPQTVSRASQSASVEKISTSTEANIQPNVTDQGTSYDILMPGVNETVQVEPSRAIKYTLTDATDFSDFYQVFKPEISSQETQAAPLTTTVATATLRARLPEVGIQAHPTTKELDVLTDPITLSEFGTQVDLEPVPEAPIIVPTVIQPVHAPVAFKEPEVEKIDLGIQVNPEKNSRASLTEKRKLVQFAVQVGDPEPDKRASATQAKPTTSESALQFSPNWLEFGAQVKPDVTDNHSSVLIQTKDVGTDGQVQVELSDKSTEITTVRELLDSAIQVKPEVKSRVAATDKKKFLDAFSQADVLLPEISEMATMPDVPTTQDASIQISTEIETEPAIIREVVQGEQYAMPQMPTLADVTDSATQTMPQTAEFSNQFEPETLDKFTEKRLEGNNFALQVSQSSTDSFTETTQVVYKTIPIQVRPRSVDKATEYAQSKPDSVDVSMQWSSDTSDKGISAEPQTMEDGTTMDIKTQLDVGSQAEFEIKVEPAIIQEVMRAPEQSVAMMNWEVATSDAVTQTVHEETKQEGTSTESIQTTDAVVQLESRNLVDGSIQVCPDVTSIGTSALSVDHTAQATQVKPNTAERGMTTMARGTTERSFMANLLPKPYRKPPSQDSVVQVQQPLNLNTQGTLTEKAEIKNTSVQVSPVTSTRGQTSRPDVREQESMTDKTPEKDITELIVPQREKQVEAPVPILRAELLDKMTQVLPPAKQDAFSTAEIPQTQVATQYEIDWDDLSTQTDMEDQPELTSTGTQMMVKRETVGTATDVTQFKTSFSQYEPNKFRSSALVQTTIPTQSTGFSPERIVLKSTGISPERTDVKSSATQYQTIAIQDSCMQTEEQEEPEAFEEEIISMEKILTLESVPQFPAVELIDVETQAEPEGVKLAETSSQTIQVKQDAKSISTTGPQFKESYIQYEPNLFRTTVSSQTNIPTRATAISTEKSSLKTTGVSPDKVEVKTSSTQYQITTTQDNSMQTEQELLPFEEPIIVLEEVDTLENMPVLPAVEMVDSEMQAEPMTTDKAILTRPERQEKTTSTTVKKYAQSFVQNVPRMASFSQQMTPQGPKLNSQGTTMQKIDLTSTPTQVKPSTGNFGQMMEPEVDEHWSMTEEPVEEMILLKEETIVESLPPMLHTETQDADVQAEPTTSSRASGVHPETADQAILFHPETREVPSQISVKHSTTYAQATVRLSSMSSQTTQEKIPVKSLGIQTQRYLTTNNSYVELKEKDYKPIEHTSDLVGIQPRGSPVTENKHMQATVTVVNNTSQSTGPEQTARGFQTEEVVEVADMEVQTNPVTIIDFVPVLVDSTVQYEPMYFYSASTQVEIPTSHQHISAVVSNRTQETSTPITKVQPSSSQTDNFQGKDDSTQTDPLPEPEPIIAPVKIEPVLFAPPPLLPETHAAESQTDSITSTDQSTSMKLPKFLHSYVQAMPKMQDTNTMTPLKQYLPKGVQEMPAMLSQVIQTYPDVKDGVTLTEASPETHTSSQTDPLPEPEPMIAPVRIEQVQFAAPNLLPEMLSKNSQTDSIHTADTSTSMQIPKLRSNYAQVSPQMQDTITMTPTTQLVPKAVQEAPLVVSQAMQTYPNVKEGSTLTDRLNVQDEASQHLPNNADSSDQTETFTGKHFSSQTIVLQVRDTNTMTTVKQYVPKAVQKEPLMQSQMMQVHPDVKEGATWTDTNQVMDSSSQTDPLPEPEPVIAPITLEPVQFAAPPMLPEMLVAESQTDDIHSVDQSTSMQFPLFQSSHVQVGPQMQDTNTMTPVRQYAPKGVQNEPAVLSQMMQTTPDVKEGATWTDTNQVMDISTQTDPLPEPEPIIAPITLEPVQFAAPPVLPEMLVAESQTDDIHSVDQSTSMQFPLFQSSHVQVGPQMQDTNTMTPVRQYAPKGVQKEPAVLSQMMQTTPDVKEGATWTDTNQVMDISTQTDPLPEPEPIIAPITLEPVQFAAPPVLPEMLVAESQTDDIHSVDQSTSMQFPLFQSSHVQVGPQMQDTNTMTPVRQYAPKGVQKEPAVMSQMMQTTPDVKEGATWTEKPQISDQASQHDLPASHMSLQVSPELNDVATSFDLIFKELLDSGTQHSVTSKNFETQTSADTRDQASFKAPETNESVCQTELTIEDLEEMLATLKQKLEEPPMIQEVIVPEKLSPVHSPMSLPVYTEDSGIQTFLETVHRSTSPILQEVKHAITQYESELKEMGVTVKPDVLDKEMETFMARLHDAAVQYASQGEDKPTQFSPDVREQGSLTNQKTYQDTDTNTQLISLSSKTMQVSPDNADKMTAPIPQHQEIRSTQTTIAKMVSRWTQRESLSVDAPIQVRPVLHDSVSQTDQILKEDVEAMLKPIQKREVRLEMRTFKETNEVVVQTDPVIIKSADSDDENESWLDSGIDTDVQTDPVVILSDVESEIEVVDEDVQTYQVDLIDVDIQVENSEDVIEVRDTTSQTIFLPQFAKTVQTEPKTVSYVGTLTMTPLVKPVSSQTVPTVTASKGFQFEPVPYLTNEDIDTQTPTTSTKEQGIHAPELQIQTSTTQTDELPVIEPEIIHVANIEPVESQIEFSAPYVEVTDAFVQATTDVTDVNSQTTKVHTTDRPSSPGIHYAAAETQTAVPVRRTRDTQYESNSIPKKTQTDKKVTLNTGIVTEQVVSQDSCLQTFLETKPEIIDRSIQHAAVVFHGYCQTEETERQHEEIQTDEVEEEIQYFTPSPEALDAFTQTTDDTFNMEVQTDEPDIVQSGTDAPITHLKTVGMQVQPQKQLQVGTTQTPKTSTRTAGTVMEPTKAVSMSVQTDIIPVRIVDEHISPVRIQPVQAPLTLPEFKPELQNVSSQTEVKTDDRSMQHDSENTQFNIFSTRLVKGEVTPTVVSEFSLTPQKKHFISHLESTAFPREEKLTYKHLVHVPTQVKPDVEHAPVQVQPVQDDRGTATEEPISTSAGVQTEFPEEPLEEIIRVSQVPVQHAPYLDLGPILLDTGTQAQPKTSEHGMSTVTPLDEPSPYLDLGPILLDTGMQASPQTSDHGMLTLMPQKPRLAWTQTETDTEDSHTQHEILLENAVSQTFIDQQEQSTFTMVHVRQESSQATAEKTDAGVQVKTEREVSVMTAGIQTVVIHEEKPEMMDMGMQFKPLHIDQATLTTKTQTISSFSNTEPVKKAQAMVQVAIKPQTEARATATMPKYSRNITTQATTTSYDACIQHDDLPDLADKGLQIKPVMVDDTSETVKSRKVDRPTQVDTDGMRPVMNDVAVQHAQEKDTRDTISQITPITTEAGVSTEIVTSDKANQAETMPEVDEIIHPDVTEVQHAPFSFPEIVTTDRSVQHQPSYDIQIVQTSIKSRERASSPVGPDYCDGSSQTEADTSDMGLQTYFQETSTAEIQAVMSYLNEESFQMESVEEDFISAQHITEEHHMAPVPKVLYQDAQVQYHPATEDSTTETVSTGIDFSGQSKPLSIEQETTTDITKYSQVEVQVDIHDRTITHDVATQHERIFKAFDAYTQVHPLTVEEGTSTMPLKKIEASVQFIAQPDKMPPTPRIVPETSEKGTSAEYVTAQSSTQTILLKSDVGIQSKPYTRSEMTHVAIKPDSHDQATDTRPDVRAFETQTYFPQKSEGSQCDRAPQIHNTSQYEKMFVEDNSVQAMPVIREQANSPIFKRKELSTASSQTDALLEELDSTVEQLMRSAPSRPFRPAQESDFMHDYSERLREYLDKDEPMMEFVEHPIERIKMAPQFEERQESSSPAWDYTSEFSSRLYDTEMTETTDIIERLFTSEQPPLNFEEPVEKDEVDWVMSQPKLFTDSPLQTGVTDSKDRSTSPLFAPTKEAQTQFDTEVVHSDTNVQVSPITSSESTFTAPVSTQDVSSQADFVVEETPTFDVATQHYTLGRDMSAQVEPIKMDASMTFKVESTPISTQARPETFEQGTSTLKESKQTSDNQTQAKPDAVAKTTSPLATRKNQTAVQAKVDQRHSTTQYDQVGSTDAVIQISPQSSDKGTSTKPDNRDISIQVVPTQRHETTQYEQSVKTVDFMVQYRAQHLDMSTQSSEVKTVCLDRANSPIHVSPEMREEKPFIMESPIQPAMVQQVSAAPEQFQPLGRADKELRQEIREEIRMEVITDIREEVREELLHEIQHEMNSRIEADVRNELRNELQITVREELREEFIEEYKEEILTEIKEELKIEFESRIRLEFEERTRDDLEFKIRGEIEPRVRRDLEPIIRREIEQEYYKETIHEVRVEAPVMYQPTEYKPEPVKPLMLDRGTSPDVANVHDAPVQASTVSKDRSSQYDLQSKTVDGVTQTQVYTAERGTTPDKAKAMDVTVQAQPKLMHRGTTPSETPHRQCGVQAVVQKTDKCDQYEAKPSQSDVATQFSKDPSTVGVPCQVQPDTEDRETSMETTKILQTYVQTENPLRRSENTQTVTSQSDAVCQSEPVFFRDTTLQVKPLTFDKSTSTLPQQNGEISIQADLLDIQEPFEKIPVQQEDSSVQYEPITEVTDRRIQARPVVREQANSPLSFLPFDLISPQNQDPVQRPRYQPVPHQVSPKEQLHVAEVIKEERVLPVEHAAPQFPSPTTPAPSRFKYTYSATDRQSRNPAFEPQFARLDYVPITTTDRDYYRPTQSQSSYRSTLESRYESSSHLTREVLQSMPPRCEMIVLQTTAAGTTYTSAFRTSTPATKSVPYSSTSYISRTSILEPGRPSALSPGVTSPILSDTESDSLPEMTELEKIRRDLRLSKVIVTDDQATLVGYLVHRDEGPRTPDLPGGSPFSSPASPHTNWTTSSFDYSSSSKFSHTPQRPRKGHQHFMNLEHTPTGMIPDVLMDKATDDWPETVKQEDWFKRETSAYRLNVPYDKKASSHPGARIVHSVSPSQSPSHTPGRTSPIYLSSEHGSSMELLPIPRGMVTRLSDLLSDGLPSDESVLPMSRLSEMIEKHHELSQPPKRSPLSKDQQSDVDTADSDTDTESFNAEMDFDDPFLHEDPHFWLGEQTDYCTPSTNSEVSSDDDTVTVYGDCDVNSFDLPPFKPLRSKRSAKDDSLIPGEPSCKRHSVIKIDHHRLREELSMSEVVSPDGPPRLTGYRMNTGDASCPSDRYDNRLSRSEPDLYRATTSSISAASPPSYSTAYPYTKLGRSTGRPTSEHRMVHAGSIPAISTEIRYARLVQKQDISHSQWSHYGRLSQSDSDLATGTDKLFHVGKF